MFATINYHHPDPFAYPFFSEELAYSLRDTGVITVTDGSCRIAPGADLQEMSLPDTVQGVVLTRIDRLAPPQQLTLKVASVIGRSFAYRLLRDIYPIAADRPSLPGQLDSLRRRSLVLPETPEPEVAWIFKHAITRDVAYELMLRAQRRALHRAIAEWYERHHQVELPRFYPLLAYHWSRTDVDAKAVQFQELAGERALLDGAYQEAVLFLAAALSVTLRRRGTSATRPDSGGPAGSASSPRRISGSATPARGGCTSAGRWGCSGRRCPPRLAGSPAACCGSSPSRRSIARSRTGPSATGGDRRRRAWRRAGPTCGSPRCSGSPTTSRRWCTPASRR
jgi:hypothetical protein